MHKLSKEDLMAYKEVALKDGRSVSIIYYMLPNNSD